MPHERSHNSGDLRRTMRSDPFRRISVCPSGHHKRAFMELWEQGWEVWGVPPGRAFSGIPVPLNQILGKLPFRPLSTEQLLSRLRRIRSDLENVKTYIGNPGNRPLYEIERYLFLAIALTERSLEAVLSLDASTWIEDASTIEEKFLELEREFFDPNGIGNLYWFGGEE